MNDKNLDQLDHILHQMDQGYSKFDKAFLKIASDWGTEFGLDDNAGAVLVVDNRPITIAYSGTVSKTALLQEDIYLLTPIENIISYCAEYGVSARYGTIYTNTLPHKNQLRILAQMKARKLVVPTMIGLPVPFEEINEFLRVCNSLGLEVIEVNSDE